MDPKEISNKNKIIEFYNDLSSITDESNPIYKDLFEKIEDIYIILNENEDDAINGFLKLDCSRYDNIKEYINNQIIRNKSANDNSNKTKSIRFKRTIIKCPFCNIPLTYSDDGIYGCTECLYEAPKQYTTPNTKTNINNIKHVIKQLDILNGQKKLPNNILKIIQYISIWLTDLKYIKRWLIYTNKLNNFILNFNNYYENVIDETFFDQEIERIAGNKWNSDIYKLFMDEFYELTELCRNILKSINNINMYNLSENDKMIVIDEWINSHKNNLKIPKENDIISINNTIYEIGNYFTLISIHPSYQNDLFFNKIFVKFNDKNSNISPEDFFIKGLMFDFDTVYKRNENIPKKYNYGQEYLIISNHVFNGKFIEISNIDKSTIISIILDFNNYYKQNALKVNSMKNNAPLFNCTLVCILNTLPYFNNKYREILYNIPNRYISSNTMSNISIYWEMYMIQNNETLKKFQNNLDTDENKIKYNII